MQCKIYRRTWSLKRKYQQEALFFDIDSFFLPYYKRCHLKAYNRPQFWWATEWNLICDEFNPKEYKDIEWFRKNVAGNFVSPKALKYIPFAKSDDDFPVHEIYEIEVVQYKVVDEYGYPISMDVYISDYIEENIKRYKNSYSLNNHHCYPSLRYYWRHPQTTNEKRQQLSKEEKRYYQENGWHMKERSKRNARNLPDLFDDKFIHVNKCWKSQTRQSRQYFRNKRAKRKRIHGDEYRNFVGW